MRWEGRIRQPQTSAVKRIPSPGCNRDTNRVGIDVYAGQTGGTRTRACLAIAKQARTK